MIEDAARWLARIVWIAIVLFLMTIVFSTPTKAQEIVVRGDTTTIVLKIVRVRDSLAIRDSIVVRDSVVIVYDTVRVDLPEPTPEPEPVQRDSIIAWSPIVEPASKDTTLYEGDTIRFRIVAAGVTAITPTGERVQRAATWDEIRSAGWYWVHSGLGTRSNLAPDGTAVTFTATRQYDRTTVSLMLPPERVAWRSNVRTLSRPAPQPEPDPEPEPEPQPEPEPEPATPTDVGYISVFGERYDCSRLVFGSSASFDGDTIRISLDNQARAWCIPYNYPAVTEGDPFWARVYPAEPRADLPGYHYPADQPLRTPGPTEQPHPE